MTRWWLPLATLLLLAPAPADAAPRGRCDKHVRGVELRTAKVIVFTRPFGEDGGRRFYACRRHGGRSHRLGIDLPDDGYYGSDSMIRDVRASGYRVRAHITEGTASATACAKYAGDPCPPIRRFVRELDTRTGRITDVPVSAP